MRTSFSRTTGSGIPAGTTRGISPVDPAAVSETAGPFVCPKINPADKRIKTKADEMVRIGSILTFDLRSMTCKTARFRFGREGRPGKQSCGVAPDCMILRMPSFNVQLHPCPDRAIHFGSSRTGMASFATVNVNNVWWDAPTDESQIASFLKFNGTGRSVARRG